MTRRESPAAVAFAAREDVASLSQRGPVTPDHVIRTKRLPLVGRDVDAYVDAYCAYYSEHGNDSLTMLDPAPRIVLDPELGMCALGTTARAADVAADIYERTIDVVLTALAVEDYQPLPAADVFAVEYWSLEQAKLARQGAPLPLTGEVALVTGAASGIGRACVDALLRRGAAVVGLDLDSAVEQSEEAAFLGIRCDVTDGSAVAAAIERAVRRFGGLDILVLNAGIFPPTRPLADLDEGEWRRTMAVNVDAAAVMLRDAHPLLALSPRGGRVAVVASKNVAAPGPGAAAYSASKAALTQLARVAALEWGRDGIRVNVVHPNAVFDTGLWTSDILEERAASYGTTVEEYRRRTLLGVEVRSRDVAEVVAELCGDAFSRTTGAQIAVDGGNDRVI
jgi:NAD(P)-dependent dehydrogenase (short-subunit alcohol dehydrogenase family)